MGVDHSISVIGPLRFEACAVIVAPRKLERLGEFAVYSQPGSDFMRGIPSAFFAS
jgi:hypothetical protein